MDSIGASVLSFSASVSSVGASVQNPTCNLYFYQFFPCITPALPYHFPVHLLVVAALPSCQTVDLSNQTPHLPSCSLLFSKSSGACTCTFTPFTCASIPCTYTFNHCCCAFITHGCTSIAHSCAPIQSCKLVSQENQ